MYNEKNFKTSHPFTFGLSMVAGIGVIVMILALGVGVIQPEANSYVIGMAILIGLALLVIGVGGWIGLTRPFAHFDDINQPAESDHGHAHAPHHAPQLLEPTHDEHGHPIVVASDHPVPTTPGVTQH